MLLRSESASFPAVLLSKNKGDCWAIVYSTTPISRAAELPCQNVHIKLALLRPQAPIQRASNLRKEGATMPEACYLMNRSPPEIRPIILRIRLPGQ